MQKALHIRDNKHLEVEQNIIHNTCNLAKLSEADESITWSRLRPNE